ncbi:hypothetical protein BWD42_21760 [Sphingobacterium sp. CZ-UAM]|uniref:DUF3267 domain-containing protein n=1 Tax=Sphingobacterium sp. CZ-UAM TaxID=1933868 RepID=UPI0009861129|nr:DUF3267 domain-containing protein [Sphingobacterium sp. CZ-UAM]OOG16365.1 hypothetical protein BWD42_21760 [Sphingobacterium sp. CZ-UAM]
MEQDAQENLKEYVIAERDANRILLQWLVPISAVIFTLYYFIWKDQFQLEKLKGWFVAQHIDSPMKISLLFLMMAIIVVVGIVVHELIHAVSWLAVSPTKSFSNISIGILKPSYTPYCHIKVPLDRNAYIIGAFAPAFILGFVPLIIGLSMGNILVYFFGYLFLLGAMGDFIIIYYILKHVDKGSKILDHPSKIGFLIQ